MDPRVPDRQQTAAQFAQSTISGMVDLMHLLAAGYCDDFEDFKLKAQKLVADYDERKVWFARERRHMRERSQAADAWILDIFSATERAIPRETLVEDFLNRYWCERDVQNHAKHDGPWLFMFETEHEHGRLVAIHPKASIGINADAFRRLCAQHLPAARDDPFLGPVLFDEQEIDGWHALWFGGSPLFDRLLDTQHRFGGEPDYWVNAVLLPGDGRYESLGIFILHRNAGDLVQPEPPAEMKQDQRLLTVLALTWRQLEHQVKSLAALSEADRRELINLIAPGLMHHEIGATMRSLYGQVFQQFELLKRLALHLNAAEDSDLSLATRYAHTIGISARRLYAVTDAFNNLDKRSPGEDSDLGRIFVELHMLITHRLGAVGVDFAIPTEEFSKIAVHTDVVLAEHALLNILTNALNAISEGQIPPPRRIRAYVEHQDGRTVTLALVNNGPPIPAHLAKDIFRRGYTTRRHGHGQGLYLARLIAHYLGGELIQMEDAALPDGFRAGFRFVMQKHLAVMEGLSRAAD